MVVQPEPEPLFQSADLRIWRVGGHHDAFCVVTFDSFTDRRTLDRPGFGEGFFRNRGTDAIHVISRENDWYQYPEMPAAMAAVHAATRRYGRVVTYGSSMGAYAALRFGGWAGADCALALSPQFSIDPRVARFEGRWQEASDRFRPLWETTLPFPVLPEAYVAFDPLDLDRRHMALLQAHCACTPIPLPGAGHPVGGFLVELGLLEPLIVDACRGAVDVPALLAEAHRRRGQSAQYLAHLAARTRSRARRIALLREALRIAPNNADVHCRLALQLGRAGRFAEAIPLHRQALELERDHPNLLMRYSITLERSGDITGALAVMEDALARSGQASLYAERVQRLRERAAGQGWGATLSRLLRRTPRPPRPMAG